MGIEIGEKGVVVEFVPPQFALLALSHLSRYINNIWAKTMRRSRCTLEVLLSERRHWVQVIQILCVLPDERIGVLTQVLFKMRFAHWIINPASQRPQEKYAEAIPL